MAARRNDLFQSWTDKNPDFRFRTELQQLITPREELNQHFIILNKQQELEVLWPDKIQWNSFMSSFPAGWSLVWSFQKDLTRPKETYHTDHSCSLIFTQASRYRMNFKVQLLVDIWLNYIKQKPVKLKLVLWVLYCTYNSIIKTYYCTVTFPISVEAFKTSACLKFDLGIYQFLF